LTAMAGERRKRSPARKRPMKRESLRYEEKKGGGRTSKEEDSITLGGSHPQTQE